MATIQVRVDDAVKSAVDELFVSLGLDTSTAVRMFFSSALEYNGIPFAIKRNKPKADLLEAIEDTRQRRNLIGPFDTVDDAMRSLLGE
ncbi:DNA-damage-inducible protein J [Campylobacterota bacterium]|nr:DNA-damage-inducible protein J [Campylobacterota bacterium]